MRMNEVETNTFAYFVSRILDKVSGLHCLCLNNRQKPVRIFGCSGCRRYALKAYGSTSIYQYVSKSIYIGFECKHFLPNQISLLVFWMCTFPSLSAKRFQQQKNRKKIFHCQHSSRVSVRLLSENKKKYFMNLINPI